eukprot:TRINITY_DN9825_c0_g1_i1.p1 TRINITY_DN9825_c0_g1~~TRINITY_DN9825_c0_g1_i1.p1  ORF type:complete len:266 (+),score=18.06 TRINITY_DN9825_c0_g1_i1:47-844(+)
MDNKDDAEQLTICSKTLLKLTQFWDLDHNSPQRDLNSSDRISVISGSDFDSDHFSAARDIVGFWYGADIFFRRQKWQTHAGFSDADELWCSRWFAKQEAGKKLDQYLRERFECWVEQALRGDLDFWAQSPWGLLALILLLDQVPRNIWRGTGRAWEGDPLALRLCQQGIEQGLDQELPMIMRAMFYMPLLHAEDMELQRQSVSMYETMMRESHTQGDGALLLIFERFHKAAVKHRDAVAIFGRFPERNAYLGRASTVEEVAYLQG